MSLQEEPDQRSRAGRPAQTAAGAAIPRRRGAPTGAARARIADRSAAKRARIIEVAMRHFAERGFQDARIADIAREIGIAKGSIFQYFDSKQGLFFEVYKEAASSFGTYLDGPPEVVGGGFFDILRYWLEQTENLVHRNWIPYRITLLGNYGSDLNLRRLISRYMATEDPYGTGAFVRRGIERGELRRDIHPGMIVATIDWTMERFQDAVLAQEFTTGLVPLHGIRREEMESRIDQFLKLLQGAIGAR